MNIDGKQQMQRAKRAWRKSEVDRAAWLRVAEGWLSLLRKRPQSDDKS
jgi:hypothetical protein